MSFRCYDDVIFIGCPLGGDECDLQIIAKKLPNSGEKPYQCNQVEA